MGSVDSDFVGASLLLASDPAAAAREAARILEQSPSHAGATLLLATASLKLGHTDRAIAALGELVRSQPTSASIQLELGKAYAASGRGADALVALRCAVNLDARLAEAWRELALQLYRDGEELAADRAYAQYDSLVPLPTVLGDVLIALSDNRLRAAEALLAQRLEAVPTDAAARRLVAEICARRDDLAAAERHLVECLATTPGYAPARFDLARILLRQQQYAQALGHVERLLATRPQNSDYLALKAQVLRSFGRNAEAISLARGLTEVEPENEDFWLVYGHLLRETGRTQESIAAYRRAAHVNPASGRAYWSMANLKTLLFDEGDLDEMRGRLARTRIGVTDRISLEFSLGKALEDRGQFAAAFEHYQRGNALHRATTVHDAAAVEADVIRSMEVYSERFFADRLGWGSDRRDPIFIVGLPRSGSTLLEQMLASHPQVEATFELVNVPGMTAALMRYPSAQAYPCSIATLCAAQVAEYAASYLLTTRQHRRLGRERFVDKMLANFGHVGFIHLMFPNAAIIDIRRHPMAGCFACYRQYFAGGSNFTYDLVELGHYYRAYARIMEHMAAVLPGRVLRVHYEDLVGNAEVELRRVLTYCGLPYDERCLRFYESGRVVQTISSEQVRKPLYTDSVDQWRRFEPWLEPLKEALGGLAETYPRP